MTIDEKVKESKRKYEKHYQSELHDAKEVIHYLETRPIKEILMMLALCSMEITAKKKTPDGRWFLHKARKLTAVNKEGAIVQIMPIFDGDDEIMLFVGILSKHIKSVGKSLR